MSPEIYILLPRVFDNIRLAVSPGNASVASLAASVAVTRSRKSRISGNGWIDLYTTFISNDMRLGCEVLTFAS